MLFPSTILLTSLLVAEIPDTIQTARIVADRGVIVSRTDTLSINQTQSVTDLLLQTPGIFVGDCGDYSGLKTISLRGMGSPHTAIYVDGFRVVNVQSGQGDVGALGLENFSSILIDYARNSLSFTTTKPSFTNGHKLGGDIRFFAGSFGRYLPSARLDWKVSNTVSLSANAAGVISKGDFPYGDGLVRENNDINQIRGGLDIFGTIPGGDWHAKAWYHGADRGAPGSISWPSSDRQKDRNAFVQGMMQKTISMLYHLSAGAKVSYDDILYESSWGDSRYGQKEARINTTHRFNISSNLILSFTADACWDVLESTIYSQKRFATMETLSAAFRRRWFRADLSVQYDGVFDSGNKKWSRFSPSLDFRISLPESFEIVSFARRAYRIPTFNELYYTGYGNPDLEAEDAWLTDIGIDWRKRWGHWSIKTKIDGYFNFLHNKITSAPSDTDPNIWLPYNIGRVRSAGIDALAVLDFSNNGWANTLSAQYSLQDAVDKTPDNYIPDQQIAYIARHSLSVNASSSFRGWSAKAAWNLRMGRRDSVGEMPDWNTLDLSFMKSFNLGKAGTPILVLSLKNITDNRYELVGGYPMPGFSMMGGIEYKL